MRTVVIFVLFIFCSLYCVNSYNILVTVFGASGSQNLIMYRMAEILGKRGHNVTILKKEVFKEAKTPKLVYSKEISYAAVNDPEILQEMKDSLNTATWKSTSGLDLKIFSAVRLILNVVSTDCESLLNNDEMIQNLKSKNFDVIIIHFVDFCSYGLARALGINGTIMMDTAYMLDYMAWYSGSPATPSYVVSNTNGISDRMTFVERMKNTMAYAGASAAFQYGVVETYSEIFKKRYGPDFPTLGQLLYDTQLFFINSDPFFEYPRPVLHNVIYVGGLTMKNAEPLTEEWEKIVADAGEPGVIVFSLGSVVNTSLMPLEMKTAFINAFKRIPQKVIWRLEGDTTEARKVPNIQIADWLPQKDLLGHPQVKAFITHGGYNSLTEATYLGVPLLMFPLFSDQYANCKRVERLKVGVTLDRDNLDEHKILHALNTVLNSDEIQRNAKRLGRMIRNKPDSSHDLVVKWVEFLAEFQNLDQLKPASIELNLLQYFLVDVFFVLFLGFILFIFVSLKCCQFCVRKTICRRGKCKID